ncbi:hypothetical protein BH09PSE5_BH09PSE5_38520 [soil metagenome]
MQEPVVGPLLYTAEVDYPEQHHPMFTQWFANRHAPDLLRAGFRTAASYRAVSGGLKVLNVYELAGPDLFKSAQYKGMSAKDPYGDAVRATSNGQQRAQTVYRQRMVAPRPSDESWPLIDADWIWLLRFSVREMQDAALVGWLEVNAQTKLVMLGAKRIRFASRTEDVVGAGTFRPGCAVLVEWSKQPSAHVDAGLLFNQDLAARVTEIEHYSGHRVYPWPDKKRGLSE